MTDDASQTDRTRYHALDQMEPSCQSYSLNPRLFVCLLSAAFPYTQLEDALEDVWKPLFAYDRLLRASRYVKTLDDHPLTLLRLPLIHDGGSSSSRALPSSVVVLPTAQYSLLGKTICHLKASSSFVQYHPEVPWVRPIFNELRSLTVFGSCGSSCHRHLYICINWA